MTSLLRLLACRSFASAKMCHRRRYLGASILGVGISSVPVSAVRGADTFGQPATRCMTYGAPPAQGSAVCAGISRPRYGHFWATRDALHVPRRPGPLVARGLNQPSAAVSAVSGGISHPRRATRGGISRPRGGQRYQPSASRRPSAWRTRHLEAANQRGAIYVNGLWSVTRAAAFDKTDSDEERQSS